MHQYIKIQVLKWLVLSGKTILPHKSGDLGRITRIKRIHTNNDLGLKTVEAAASYNTKQ